MSQKTLKQIYIEKLKAPELLSRPLFEVISESVKVWLIQQQERGQVIEVNEFIDILLEELEK